MEENKKKPVEEEEKVSETSSEEQQNESKPDEKKADEQKNESEKSEVSLKTDEKSEEDKSENISDEKDAEILRLKTQISAMQSGIKPDCVEDAVAIAESYIKAGKCNDINSALSDVVKKYPDMKSNVKDNKKQGGFKIGAESQEKETTNESRLDNAFGIRKKK